MQVTINKPEPVPTTVTITMSTDLAVAFAAALNCSAPRPWEKNYRGIGRLFGEAQEVYDSGEYTGIGVCGLIDMLEEAGVDLPEECQ